MKRAIEIARSGGNVFKDLGLSSPDEKLAKAGLTAKIAEAISRKGLTQKAVAVILGIDQPKVSALLCGRMSGFSTERLLRFLTALGWDIEIVVRERPEAEGRGHLLVVSA